MFGFGKKTPELSVEAKAAVLKSVLEKSDRGDKSSLRVLIAGSMGNGTGADDRPVTDLIENIRSYGLLGKVDVTDWWEKADSAVRKSVLDLAAAYIVSR